MENNENNVHFTFSEKWSHQIEQLSFTQVPNLLLRCQGHLKLTDGELLTLIHLTTFWFNSDSKVYPSITTLSRFSLKGYSTIQARLMNLERKGFVKRRHQLGTSNVYDLTQCVEKLNEHASVCDKLPQKQGVKILKSSNPLSWISMSKEYEGLRRQSPENTWDVEKLHDD